MRLLNFIVFLTAGALMGWLAGRMIEAENSRLVKVNMDYNDSD